MGVSVFVEQGHCPRVDQRVVMVVTAEASMPSATVR